MKRLLVVFAILSGLLLSVPKIQAAIPGPFLKGQKVFVGGMGVRVRIELMPIQFMLAGDVEFYMARGFAFNLGYEIGFGEASSFIIGAAPGGKYRFNTKSLAVPYVKLTMPLAFAHATGINAFAITFRFGGGVDFFWTKNLGAGIDLGFGPGVGIGSGGAQFVMGLELLFHMAYRF